MSERSRKRGHSLMDGTPMALPVDSLEEKKHASAPMDGASAAPAVAAPAAGAAPATVTSMFTLHDGEHSVSTVFDRGPENILIFMENKHTGDAYEITLGTEDIAKISPEGLPQALLQPSAFYANLIVSGFGAEQKSVHASLGSGVVLACASKETGDTFDVSMTVTVGDGIFAREWAVRIPVPVKERATTEKTHQIALRALRQDFQKEVDSMRTEMQLIRLQLNSRVFFGPTHSVHIGSKQLIMPLHIEDVTCHGCDELRNTDGTVIKFLSNHANSGNGNFQLQNCDCLAACSHGANGHKLRASEVATRSSVEQALNQILVKIQIEPVSLEGCDALKTTDGTVMNHVQNGRGNFLLQKCSCLGACGCGTNGHKLRASEIATRSSVEQALNRVVAHYGGQPLVLEGCDALKTTDGTVIRDLQNHAAKGRGNFQLQGCGCLAACGCGKNGQKLRACDVASVSSITKAIQLLQERYNDGFVPEISTMLPVLSAANLSPIRLCHQLEHLAIGGGEVDHIEFVRGLKCLRTLLIRNSRVTVLDALATTTSLKQLHITAVDQEHGIIDLAPLAALPALADVSFKGSTALMDITPLAGLRQLRTLNVTGTSVVNLLPLQAQAHLTVTGVTPGK
jgi:NADH:ubiquinone oxidoreductase subunit E